MNTNGTTGPIPIRLQHANPLLYTLQQDHMTIQPYWIMVLQMLAIQLLQRVWSLIRYKVFLTTLEIGFIRYILWFQIRAIQTGFYEGIIIRVANSVQRSQKQKLSIQQQRAQLGAALSPYLHQHNEIKGFKETRVKLRRKLKFDLFDIVVYFIPIFGHSIWYCYIQSSCMKAEKATHWNCYNAFGYRLYNYVFASYFSFLCSFGVKLLVLLEVYLESREPKKIIQPIFGVPPEKEPSRFKIVFDWIGKVLGFWSSLIVFCFTGALVLPYVFTNVIPMVFVYIFMHFIYFAIWPVVLFIVLVLAFIPIIDRLLTPRFILPEYRKYAIGAVVFAFGFYTYPILLSTLYNYSQYFYYGEDYFKTMKNEFDTRDTRTYFNVLTNSVNEKLHTSIGFF